MKKYSGQSLRRKVIRWLTSANDTKDACLRESSNAKKLDRVSRTFILDSLSQMGTSQFTTQKDAFFVVKANTLLFNSTWFGSIVLVAMHCQATGLIVVAQSTLLCFDECIQRWNTSVFELTFASVSKKSTYFEIIVSVIAPKAQIVPRIGLTFPGKGSSRI